MEETQSAEEFLQKLKRALQRDGDFPASAKVVVELRQLVLDPKTTASKVTEVILKEPSLGTRVLSLVNSSYYQRVKPIMTVSQAVVQVGMKPLAELCAGLVLLQKFVPQARQNAPFANCLRKTILTSLLTSSISPHIASTKGAQTDETGYLAGSFAELGTLLLAFYFPNIYENALKRSETKRVELKEAIRQLTGLSPIQISAEVLRALELPTFYVDVLQEMEKLGPPVQGEKLPILKEQIRNVGRSVSGAETISGAISSSKNKMELDSALKHAQKMLGIDTKALHNVVGTISVIFKDHCESLQLTLPPLPEFLSSFATPDSDVSTGDGGPTEQFGGFVEEIRAAVEAREPTASIITTVMEACAWGLQFDRVLLMLVGGGKQKLQGRMLLGKVENFNPTSFERSIGPEANTTSPEVKAFREGTPIYVGPPLLPGGSPIAAIPIGVGKRAVGVIYADRVSPKESLLSLSEKERSAVTLLSELLDRSLSGTSRGGA